MKLSVTLRLNWKAGLAWLLGALFFTSVAGAQDTACSNYRLEDFAALRVARVTAPKAMFLNTQGKSTGRYVIKGDWVLQGPLRAGRRCSYFVQSGKPDVGGVLAEKQVQKVMLSTPPVGHWVRDKDAEVTILAGNRIEGNALWPTPGGSVNTGNLDGKLIPVGAGWVYQDASTNAADPNSCMLTVLSVGPVLLVEDNGQCGGLNVTFTGEYTKGK